MSRFKLKYIRQKNRIEAAMRQSKSWSRQTEIALKGNHRRRGCIGGCTSGVMGNTHGTPSLRRGAINNSALCVRVV